VRKGEKGCTTRIFFIIYALYHEIIWNLMSGIYSMHIENEKCTQLYFFNLNHRENLEIIDVDGEGSTEGKVALVLN
jgi:hypothetical protein